MLINRSEDVLHFIFNSSWSDITTVFYSSRRRGSTPDSLAGSEQPGIMFSLSFQISNRWKEDKLEEENWRIKGRGFLLCFQNNCQTLHIRPSTRWSSKHSTAGTRRTTLSSATFPLSVLTFLPSVVKCQTVVRNPSTQFPRGQEDVAVIVLFCLTAFNPKMFLFKMT